MDCRVTRARAHREHGAGACVERRMAINREFAGAPSSHCLFAIEKFIERHSERLAFDLRGGEACRRAYKAVGRAARHCTLARPARIPLIENQRARF